MAHTTIEWGDGYISVYPSFPEKLIKALRYWHRSLETIYGKTSVTGEYRYLYKQQVITLPDGTVGQSLLTMPGFMHRIKTILSEEGYTYDIIDKRTPAPTANLLAAFKGLRDYQLPAIYIALQSGGGIIACPTGYGKTHIIKAIINAYSHDELCARNTPIILVTAPEKDIVFKNYNDLKQLLPDREVGIVMSGHKKQFSEDVQVITLDSLHLIPNEDVGIIISDEVHTAASERRTELLLSFRKALKWGVSATPTGRFDGRDLVTEGIFGPVIYRRTYDQCVKDGALVPINVYWIRSPKPSIKFENYLAYKTRTGKYRYAISKNDNRNKLIGELLHRIPDSLQTLCIMPYLEHMNNLLPYCPQIKYVHGTASLADLQKAGYKNLSAIQKEERKDIYQGMADGTIRKVISTYIYKQGVNFPQLSIIINAGGGGSEIAAQQIPGRESRNVDGKDIAYLIDFWHDWDIVEDDTSVKQKYGQIHKDDLDREKCYTELNFKQFWIDSIDQLPFLNKPNQEKAWTK